MVQLKGMGKRKRRQKEQVRKGKPGLLEVCFLAVIAWTAMLWPSISLAVITQLLYSVPAFEVS